MTTLDPFVDDFCAVEWSFHPVDASFAGAPGYDGALPPCDDGAASRERRALAKLLARLEANAPVPAPPGAALDRKLARAQIAHRLRMLDQRPLHHNPAWATGEAAFGLIALLLREGEDVRDGLVQRVAALPDFFANAAERLRGAAAHRDWVARAATECAALDVLLADLPYVRDGARADARQAVARFAAGLVADPAADPACGSDYFAFLMRDVHGLDETPAELEARASEAFARGVLELEEAAARGDGRATWRDRLARIAEIGPDGRDVLPSYRAWHARALADAAALVSPATDYELAFRPLEPWAQRIYDKLYFLFYRSPRAFAPGTGSTYWVVPPGDDAADVRRTHNTAAVKIVHAVHHGSIGHHTQNARARSAPSRLARIAGTDGASALAFLAAGTMVEGWACYAEDLLAEVPGFYTDDELLQHKYMQVRGIASALADVRLHTGTWTLDEMRAFYRDEVAFAPARIHAETTRNAMFPASRIMYWTGVEQIKALRARSPLPAKAFHDRLLSFGSAPVAWIADELDVPA